MLRVTTFVLLALAGGVVFAQEPPCGLRVVTESIPAWYPPIGRAAHVSGTVVLMATFTHHGEVSEVHAVSGPSMLTKPAEAFVKGWEADEYTGPRTCPVVVEYKLAGDTVCTDEDATKIHVEPSRRLDTQHYRVTGYSLALCDPAGVIGPKRRRFGIF